MVELNRETYLKIVNEDIDWLLKNTTRCEERDHIITILMDSIPDKKTATSNG